MTGPDHTLEWYRLQLTARMRGRLGCWGNPDMLKEIEAAVTQMNGEQCRNLLQEPLAIELFIGTIQHNFDTNHPNDHP